MTSPADGTSGPEAELVDVRATVGARVRHLMYVRDGEQPDKPALCGAWPTSSWVFGPQDPAAECRACRFMVTHG